MNTSNQQYYGNNAYQNRSDLLSGLRTEGLGLGSVFPPQAASQQSGGRNGATSPYMQTANLRQHQSQQQQQHYQPQQQNNTYRTQESLRDISALQASLEDQLAAMRLQSSLSLGQSDAQSGYPNYSNGYAQQQQQQYLQMQLQQQLAQQQAAAQQQRMELLRLQALQKQQQQQQQQQQQYGQQYGQQQYNQQQLAAQQRFLLAQLQGGNSDYEGASSHQAHLMSQAQSAAASAQEQRQAAQASIQASLRQRQVQQLYQTIGLENDGPATGYSEQQQQQQQQQLQLQNILNRHTRKVSSDGPSPARTPLEQRSWRGGATVPAEERLPTPPGQRGASPASSIHSRKGMRPSSGTADSILSMRSRTMTPSIVIDDSASEGSRAQSEGDQVEGDQTPETSEEDLEVNTPVAKALSSTPTPQQMHMPRQGTNGRYGSLGRGAAASAPTSTSTTPPIPAPKAIPRAIHLSAAPQHRAFKTNGGASSDGNTTINNAGLTLPPIQPRRQPKGQPTEFHKVNFQARMNSRLRRDAMSKLCASPRAASFGGNGMSFGARLSSAGSMGVPAAAP